MKRATWFDIAGIVVLTLLSACGCCTGDCPPIPTEGCIGPRFDPDDDPYLIDAPSSPTACDDPAFEPNDDLPRAATGATHECSATKSAHIKDDLDVDVFRTGNCGSLIPNIDALVHVHASFKTSTDTLRLCVIPMCRHGATTVTGCEANPDKRSIDDATLKWGTHVGIETGFAACCRVEEGTIDVEAHCVVDSSEVDTYFWVDGGDVSLGSCADYTLEYDVQ